MDSQHQLLITDRNVRYVIRSCRRLTEIERSQAIQEFQVSGHREPVSIRDYPHITHDIFIDIPPDWRFPDDSPTAPTSISQE